MAASEITVTPGSGMKMATDYDSGTNRHTSKSYVTAVVPPSGDPETGQKTLAVSGTRERLVASSTPVSAGVWLQADVGNGGRMYFGGSSVSTTSGVYLVAGEKVWFPTNDLYNVYIDSTVGGEKMNFTGA